MHSLSLRAALGAALAAAHLAPAALALQTGSPDTIQDQIVFGSWAPSFTNTRVVRFDRKLRFLGSTQVQGIGGWTPLGGSTLVVGPTGRYSVNVITPTLKQVWRFRADLSVEAIQALPFHPIGLAADPSGDLFALCETLTPPAHLGPLMRLDSAGSVLWSSSIGAQTIKLQFPLDFALTEDGSPWIGGFHKSGGADFARALELSGADGSIVSFYDLGAVVPFKDPFFRQLVAAPGSKVWMYSGEILPVPGHAQFDGFARFLSIDGGSLEQSAHFDAQNVGDLGLRVDAFGRAYQIVDDGFLHGQPTVNQTKILVRIDPSIPFPAPPVDTYWDLGEHILFWTFGPTGEEVYAIRWGNCCVGIQRQLLKLSLVTGQMSWVSIEAVAPNAMMLKGDPTGFVFATTGDPFGDNDGDGFPNRQEVRAGYNPFDAASRPGGPKAYLHFDATKGNAIVLDYVDPDGILNAQKGLDLASFSLVAEHPLWGSGEIFPDLAAHLTEVNFSADRTKVSLVFGGAPLQKGLGFGLTASVRDRTGLQAWDWQLTPQ